MNLNDLFTEEKVRLDPKCWTGKKIGNPKTKMKGGVRVNNCVPAESIEENAGQPLSVQQLATISDAALDAAYGYGRSTPGNTFGWQANLKSAAYAKQMIDQGVTDIEAISDAIHKGWNTTAQAFVQDPEQFDDTAKLAAAGKLEAKLQQRAQLMKQNYAQLPEEEKEKDRVVARALLQAIRGPQQQGVAEGFKESYMIIRTDAEGKQDVFAGNFDTYEQAQKELDSLLLHPLHTKYKQKFQIKRKGGEQGVAEGSDEIRTAGRGAIRIPGDMSAPHWREPTWSFQEIAQKLGIPVSALNLLAFNRIGGFPEALPGLAARYGSKKYYKQSEIKRWVNANNVREKLKQGMLEAKPPGLRRDPLDLPPLEGPGSGGGSGGGGTSPRWSSTKIPGVSSHTGPAPKVTQSPNINTKIDAAANVPAYVRRGLPDPVTTPVNKPKITVRPGETQSQAMQRSQTEKEFGKFLQGQSGQTFGPATGRGNTNPSAPNWKNDQTDIDLEEAGKQQKGADYRDPKEVDYDGEYDAMVARVKRLAGLGPMKTVYDPTKRQYRNMPIAVQPKK